MKSKIKFISIVLSILLMSLYGCNSNSNKTNTITKSDSTNLIHDVNSDSAQVKSESNNKSLTEKKNELPIVFIYNFHISNRCVSCIAIEEATTKTLNTYFPSELQQGRIKRRILNVDDEKNAKIAEKYQVFGSGLYITRVFNGKETTTDMTGDGFKYARKKEEKFMEILKNTINEYLK
jgi:hypothetical protein